MFVRFSNETAGVVPIPALTAGRAWGPPRTQVFSGLACVVYSASSKTLVRRFFHPTVRRAAVCRVVRETGGLTSWSSSHFSIRKPLSRGRAPHA